MRHHTEDHRLKCECDADDEVPCPHVLCAEVAALEALVDDFAKAMKHKLRAKMRHGKKGWDDESWTKPQIMAALKQHAEKGDPVDIANIAAFLWNRG
jgi:hypothetical protein